MSIRALWILTSNVSFSVEDTKLLFYRHFPTVERKIRDTQHYVPLPSNSEFVASLLVHIEATSKSLSFNEFRDSCKTEDQKPVFGVNTTKGVLWPVVVIEQGGLLICCLPAVSQDSAQNPAMIEIPGVSIAFSLLCGIFDYLKSLTNQDITSRVGQLNMFLSEAAPFGKVRDCNAESLSAKICLTPSTAKSGIMKTQRQPSWKPAVYKGKCQIYLSVIEYIRAIQYNDRSTPDVWNMYGSVTCKADLEGPMPDVTLNISHVSSDGNAIPLDHLLIHPCVQSADSAPLPPEDVTREPRVIPRRIRFTPTGDMFLLAHYTASRLKELPVRGHFQMKGDMKLASITIKLTLNNKVKNLFEYCELQIPFPTRGKINNFDASPSQGNAITSPDKKILVWNIGQKFPSKSGEVTLNATVKFADTPKREKQTDDPFAASQNIYAQLYFKISDFTHSGCNIDPKSIQISPSTKFKLVTAREYQSVEYKIWNSLGDAWSVPPPPSIPESNNQ